MQTSEHTALTIDQCTRQAVPFAKLPAHLAAMDVLIQLAGPTARDSVLDVACSPGLVACSFAPRVEL